MNVPTLLKSVILLPASLAFSAMAHGQAGVCKDPWITQAFHQMHNRAPLGSGSTGECDITRYGNGHWTTFADLEQKIAAHEAAEHPLPAPTSLRTPSPVRPGSITQPSTQLAPASAPLVNQNGSRIISDAGGNQINRNSNIISQDGGGLHSNSSGTVRSVQSVDKPRAAAGKYLVIPGGDLVDASGNVVRHAGTYMLLQKNGSYTVGTGAGARTPASGLIVNP